MKFKPIYKFRANDKWLFKLIKKSELYFSSPLNFNDPFDSNLKVVNLIDKEQIIENYQTSQKPTDSFFSNILNVALDNDYNRKTITSILNEQFYQFARTTSICSFSKSINNLLMWAHYADCHKGVCIGFDPMILKQTFGDIYDVDYCSKIPEINVLSEPSVAVKQFYCTKSQHWKYEKEARIMSYEFGACRFPKSALVRMIFGVKCTPENQKNIMELMKKFKYQNVEFFRTFIDTKQFRLLAQRIHLR